jgi:Mn2+/Fe2+ NRAMP family transporter
VLGGFAFNIGNIAGCALGLHVLTGMEYEYGAIISALIGLILFWIREIGKMLDTFTKVLGILKISLTFYILLKAKPPILDALHHTIFPEKISALAIVTIVGGTVGGYITFSGAHRLIDAGITGKGEIKKVNRSAMSGIFISSFMRYILFLAAVGVLLQGAVLDKDNPAGTVFKFAAGELGFKIFGIVLWSAAISSVVGAAYTSVSFLKTFHPALMKKTNERWSITIFIIISTIVFIWLGRPKELLIAAGAINGLILPFALSIILVAATRKQLMGSYRHPIWMQVGGWIVVAAMGWMGAVAIGDLF